MKISDLQSQIALNRPFLEKLEDDLNLQKYNLKNTKFRSFFSDAHKEQTIEQTKVRVKYLKKKIKQYAKLQRALKSELAYRIRYNRYVRSVTIDVGTLELPQEGE